jgi:Bacterial Ig-like domain (group 3)
MNQQYRIPTPTPTLTPRPTPTPAPTPTPRPTPTAPPAPATPTTTTLTVVRVPLPLGLGGFAIPTALVPPSNATGTVQLKDGATNLGGPVSVLGGIAVGPISVLGKGQHQLIAVFTSTDPTKFKPSTSNTVTFTF